MAFVCKQTAVLVARINNIGQLQSPLWVLIGVLAKFHE